MPIVTLLSDFGLQDGYVACMKGVILGIAPEVDLVDVSHLIAPQDVRSAGFVLFTAYRYFPPGTVHLAVVDPGVGTERKAIAVRTESGFFVGPDNGIFSLVLKNEAGFEARNLENADFQLRPLSSTFHGRDLFAPAAAHIARGASFDLLGPETAPMIAQWSSPVRGKSGIEGEIIHIDRFGNCITNVTLQEIAKVHLASAWRVKAGQGPELPLYDTYSRVQPGNALALAGSSGFVEIAVNRGNAALNLGLRIGTAVYFLLERA